MSERGDEETKQWLCVVRENMELQKRPAILVLYDAMVLSRCWNWSGTETILSYVKLTFKSTRGTDTMQKLAEIDPKSALRLPKWVMITMAKEKL